MTSFFIAPSDVCFHTILTIDDDPAYELLDWSLISHYDNAESKHGRREYKAKFALLPTIDHVGDGLGTADFKIARGGPIMQSTT